MSNAVYDKLRVLQDILPIIGTLATTLLALYGAGENVVAIVGGTFTALTAALVSLLRVSNSNYKSIDLSYDLGGDPNDMG